MVEGEGGGREKGQGEREGQGGEPAATCIDILESPWHREESACDLGTTWVTAQRYRHTGGARGVDTIARVQCATARMLPLRMGVLDVG